MIKDIIADHFSGNPQAGCRVTYPISRFLVHMDHVRIANHPHRPLSPEPLRRRRLESVGDLVPRENAVVRFPLSICSDLIRKGVGLSTLQPLLRCQNSIRRLLQIV
jgi:hypothetical protein